MLQDQHQFDAARPLFERALSITEAAYGQSHAAVAVSVGNLAMLYKEQKQYEQARPLFERALAIHQQQLGNEHPAVALSMINLGELLIATKSITEPEPYSRVRSPFMSARTVGSTRWLLTT